MKYICPDCGGTLSFISDALVTFTVNPQTGTKSMPDISLLGEEEQLYCNHCGFEYNTGELFNEIKDLPTNKEEITWEEI